VIKFKTRTGSSSILVILLVVTMVVFGVLAMMSSYSGLKMARKTAQWTQDYYELESKAEIMLYDVKKYSASKHCSIKYNKSRLLD